MAQRAASLESPRFVCHFELDCGVLSHARSSSLFNLPIAVAVQFKRALQTLPQYTAMKHQTYARTDQWMTQWLVRADSRYTHVKHQTYGRTDQWTTEWLVGLKTNGRRLL